MGMKMKVGIIIGGVIGVFAISTFTFCSVGCCEESVREYYKSGKLKSERSYNEEKQLHGPYNIYYENGQLQEEEIYKNGFFDGPHKTYYENGQLKSEAFYKNGKAEGLSRDYYRNGNIQNEEVKKSGKRDGLYRAYNENGKISEEGNYKNGMPDGLWKRYYPSGMLNSEMVYENGKPEGRGKYYYMNGELVPEDRMRLLKPGPSLPARLELTIRPDKQMYEVGEEIVVNVRFKNLSSETLTMTQLLGCSEYDDHFHFWGWDSHGGMGSVERRALEKISFVELKPQGIAEGRYALKTPADTTLSPFFRGKVKIEAKFRHAIHSNAIFIEVKEDHYKGISREQALEIAKKLCEGSGYEWKDIYVREEKYKWKIITNSGVSVISEGDFIGVLDAGSFKGNGLADGWDQGKLDSIRAKLGAGEVVTKEEWAKVLNEILAVRMRLEDYQHFQALQKNPSIQNIFSQTENFALLAKALDPVSVMTPEELEPLNRKLLEAVYPKILAKSPNSYAEGKQAYICLDKATGALIKDDSKF
jgi:antitoxin component YwqK of YwqJK toxin-antitoxin module